MTTFLEVHNSVWTRLRAAGFTFGLIEENTADPIVSPCVKVRVITFRDSSRGPSEYGGGRGQNRYRVRGYLEVQVFTDLNQGMEQALQIAEQVCALFRSQRVDGVSYEAATVHGAIEDNQPDGKWFISDATVYFYFDQIG